MSKLCSGGRDRFTHVHYTVVIVECPKVEVMHNEANSHTHQPTLHSQHKTKTNNPSTLHFDLD